MVAKRGKTAKKMKDLGARKVTSAQAKKVKGGMSSATGGAASGKPATGGASNLKGWIDIY
jgi:hypothetical protein